MKIHLVIIDALNLIRRVHSAQPNQDDLQAVITTTTRTINKILKETNPSHIVAIFDHHNQDRGWRANVLPTYKEDRKPMPHVLQQGLDEIQNAWWQLGIDSLLSDGDEADDLVATLANKVASRNEQVTIISTDKGYCQLLSPTLRIRDYFQHRWLDDPFIEKEFGVKPTQLTNYWGLTGISSSKITGIPGIGPKAALDILAQYPTIEAANESADLAKKYRKKFDEHYETALLCRKVATLKTDIELGFNLQDIRYAQDHQ